jgi:hypothetical protein
LPDGLGTGGRVSDTPGHIVGDSGEGPLRAAEYAERGLDPGGATLRPGSWLEVFFDLVFAAAITQTAQIL